MAQITVAVPPRPILLVDGSNADTQPFLDALGLTQSLNYEAFGAVGDGVTDDTLAVAAAESYLNAHGGVFVAKQKSYKIASTIQILSAGDRTLATFLVNSASVSPAVRIGKTSASLIPTGAVHIGAPACINTAKTGTGWVGYGVGTEIANIDHATITIPEQRGFAIGLDVGGYSEGVSYNTIHSHFLNNNQVNFQAKPKNSTGWANQNLIYLNRCFHDSSEGTAVSGTRQIQLLPFDVTTTANWPNNNTIGFGSVEGDTAEFHAVLCGDTNILDNVRWEASSPKVKYLGHASTVTTKNCAIRNGTSADHITYTIENPAGVAGNRHQSGVTDRIAADDVALALTNLGGGGADSPHLLGYQATSVLNAKSTDSTYVYALWAQGFGGKDPSSAYLKTWTDFVNGRQYFGTGAAAATGWIGRLGTAVGVNNDFLPAADNTFQSGTSSLAWSGVTSYKYSDGSGNQVVGARSTGWTAMTGSGSKGALAQYDGQTVSASYTQAEAQATDNAIKALSARIASVDAALRTHGLFGS